MDSLYEDVFMGWDQEYANSTDYVFQNEHQVPDDKGHEGSNNTSPDYYSAAFSGEDLFMDFEIFKDLPIPSPVQAETNDAESEPGPAKAIKEGSEKSTVSGDFLRTFSGDMDFDFFKDLPTAFPVQAEANDAESDSEPVTAIEEETGKNRVFGEQLCMDLDVSKDLSTAFPVQAQTNDPESESAKAIEEETTAAAVLEIQPMQMQTSNDHGKQKRKSLRLKNRCNKSKVKVSKAEQSKLFRVKKSEEMQSLRKDYEILKDIVEPEDEDLKNIESALAEEAVGRQGSQNSGKVFMYLMDPYDPKNASIKDKIEKAIKSKSHRDKFLETSATLKAKNKFLYKRAKDLRRNDNIDSLLSLVKYYN